MKKVSHAGRGARGEGRAAERCWRCVTALLAAGLFVLLWLKPVAAQETRPVLPWPVAQSQIVATIHYPDAAALAQLTGAYDVWEVDRRARSAVVLLDRAEIQTLAAAGYRVVPDPVRTAALPTPVSGPRTDESIPGFACYRTVTETYAAIDALVAAHPTLAQKVDIGDSWLKTQNNPTGDDIFALLLTNQEIAGPKPRLFVMAAIHARELATAESALRFAEQLVNGYGVDADATWLLDYTELHIVTQANPDGRRRAETGVLWRKNVNSSSGCFDPDSLGVDLNRNSSFKWGICTAQGCSSFNACAETYRGPGAASEPEVQALENYMRAIFPDQRGPGDNDPAPLDASGVMITVHSYGEWVLYPWGYTPAPAPNEEGLRVLGQKLGYYLPRQLGGQPYIVCQAGAGNCLYPTDGATDDFSYGELGIPSYTFEIGSTFFQSCSSYESKIAAPVLAALRYAAKVSHRPYQQPFGPEAIGLAVTPATVQAGEPATLRVTLDNTRFAPAEDSPDPAAQARAILTGVVTLGQPRWVTATVAPTFTLTPIDGIFDSPVEDALATIDTSGWAAGNYLLVVEGQNINGKWGAPGATFLTVQGQQPPKAVDLWIDSPLWQGIASGNLADTQITFGNNGPYMADTAVITASWSSEITFVAANPIPAHVDRDSVTWAVMGIGLLESRPIRLVFAIPSAPIGTSYHVTYQIRYDGIDEDLGNNSTLTELEVARQVYLPMVSH